MKQSQQQIVAAELAELAQLRLDRDLSYAELGRQLDLTERTVHRLINHPPKRLYDRTLYKIRRYLRLQREAREREDEQQALAFGSAAK